MVSLKSKHDTQDLWAIPRDEWEALQREYADRLRELHGRDPKTGEKTPGRLAEERRAAKEQDEESAESIIASLKALM